jgi:hypothetical protein
MITSGNFVHPPAKVRKMNCKMTTPVRKNRMIYVQNFASLRLGMRSNPPWREI